MPSRTVATLRHTSSGGRTVWRALSVALLVPTALLRMAIALLLVVEAQDLATGGETEHSPLVVVAVALPAALGLTGLCWLVRQPPRCG